VIDFVCELAPSHHFSFGNDATLIRDDLLIASVRRITSASSRPVHDENYFVSSFICQNNLLRDKWFQPFTAC
jgi:hypothetical protein